MPQWNIITQLAGTSQKSCFHTAGADVDFFMQWLEDNSDFMEDSEATGIKILRAMSLNPACPLLALPYKLLSATPKVALPFQKQKTNISPKRHQ